MDEFIDHEPMIFALGGDLECPECNIEILIPCGAEDSLNTLLNTKMHFE
jgi:hypothetical protein